MEAVTEGEGVNDGRDGRAVGESEGSVAAQATQGGGGEGAEREEASVAVAYHDVRVLQGSGIAQGQLTARDAGLPVESVRPAQREIGRTGFGERQFPEASRENGVGSVIGRRREGQERTRALSVVEDGGGIGDTDDAS